MNNALNYFRRNQTPPSAAVELQQQEPQPQAEQEDRAEPREENDNVASPPQREVVAQRDIESNQPITANKDFIGGSDDKMYNGPMARFEPIRTDQIKALKDRQKRLDDRITAKGMPEIHFVGQITSGQGLIMDTTEGAFCRYVYYSYINHHPPQSLCFSYVVSRINFLRSHTH